MASATANCSVLPSPASPRATNRTVGSGSSPVSPPPLSAPESPALSVLPLSIGEAVSVSVSVSSPGAAVSLALRTVPPAPGSEQAAAMQRSRENRGVKVNLRSRAITPRRSFRRARFTRALPEGGGEGGTGGVCGLEFEDRSTPMGLRWHGQRGTVVGREARLLHGNQPAGYTPRRPSTRMPPLPALAPDVDAMEAWPR